MIDPVTSRYAEALYRLSHSRGALAAVRGDVERLGAALSGPLAVVFDERLPLETRRARATEHLNGCHQLTKNFLELVFDKRRVEVLRHLAAAFHRLTLEERGAAEGVVESARALGPAELAALAKALGPVLHKELALTNRVLPELIGGVRVVVASKMIDVSLQGRLESLKKRMLAAPLPRLEV